MVYPGIAQILAFPNIDYGIPGFNRKTDAYFSDLFGVNLPSCISVIFFLIFVVFKNAAVG
ncbi:hypothetical protein SDC9_109554 [bioreactor metagenome]|uniref:Uncharacterized protein n=1 Tax=bioreactor metagenome TaxID=1076179 RepID=A0A645BBH7_9ZZZZ